MLHICTCSLSFINHFEKNAWHVTIHYLMNRNRFEKKRESGHQNGIAKFLTVHTGYIDKNKKKISFSKILHISQRYSWQTTIIFIYSIIDCLCVCLLNFVEIALAPVLKLNRVWRLYLAFGWSIFSKNNFWWIPPFILKWILWVWVHVVTTNTQTRDGIFFCFFFMGIIFLNYKIDFLRFLLWQ